jgi:tRNA (guanine-N7-)-methyltransferase
LFIENFEQHKNNLKAIFGNDNPIHIEIGCGKGRFITETAKKNPDINYIAIERNGDVTVLACEKINNEGINNVKFLFGNCQQLEMVEDLHSVERIYVNFCDPWKKSKQAKRRLTHANFLKLYEKLLKDGGELHFKTDNTKLFEFSLNSFADYGLKMKNITLDLHNSKFEGNIMTEYEQLFSEKGQPIYRCEVVFNVGR